MNNLSRRSLVQAGIASILGASFHARRGYAQSGGLDRPLRVATFRGMDSTILPATGQLANAAQVEFHEFNAGNLITRAIDADAIDLGGWSEIPLVFAAAARSDARAVAVLQGPSSNQAVVVPAGSAAHSIADLKGKRVGYLRATTAHYFLLKMLQQSGLKFSDIQAVPLGMSEGLTAMRSGSLDAWATYGYAIPTIEHSSGARVLRDAVGILSGNYLIGANARYLDSAPFRNAVADYIRHLGKAYEILDADKPRWARIVSPVVGIPEPLVLQYLQMEERPMRVRPIQPGDIASAQEVADTFAAAGLLSAGTQVAPYFTDVLAPLLKQG